MGREGWSAARLALEVVLAAPRALLLALDQVVRRHLLRAGFRVWVGLGVGRAIGGAAVSIGGGRRAGRGGSGGGRAVAVDLPL